jgi:hypothetical protein
MTSSSKSRISVCCIRVTTSEVPTTNLGMILLI